MKYRGKSGAGIIRRYIGLQLTLLISGITLLTLGLSYMANNHFDSVALYEEL